jgi:predicted Zn-dependent protease
VKNRTLFFTLSAIGMALATAPLTGCGYLKARAAKSAYNQYQQALAAGDMAGARNALLALVKADEDVADYWIELGKLQLQLGDYRQAYDAFSHAHELDRTDVQVLATMAQMALMSGDMDTANEHGRALAMLEPNSPTVTIVDGYMALKSGDLEKAAAAADKVLAQAPRESFATILKSRVLIAGGHVDDAITLLEDQHRAVPQDRSAIHGLTNLYRLKNDWRHAARVADEAHRLDPKNGALALDVVEDLLRAGDVPAASRASAPLMTPTAPPLVLQRALELWATYAPPNTVLPSVSSLANAVDGDRRASFGDYFNRMGKPQATEELLRTSQLPVTHLNARWNSVFAQSLALQGKAVEAKRLFDLVLDREPDQIEALRGRSALETKTGLARQAVIDAQRLVTISPASGPDRLLLAQAYLAAGNRNEVRRTLWQAFQDLPDDEGVFSALKSVLASTGDVDGQRRLDDEFKDRRMAKLTKELA